MLKLKVPDMSCGHCAATIEKAARSVDPAAEVDVDLTTKVATIATTAPTDRVRSAPALQEGELDDAQTTLETAGVADRAKQPPSGNVELPAGEDS